MKMVTMTMVREKVEEFRSLVAEKMLTVNVFDLTANIRAVKGKMEYLEKRGESVSVQELENAYDLLESANELLRRI